MPSAPHSDLSRRGVLAVASSLLATAFLLSLCCIGLLLGTRQFDTLLAGLLLLCCCGGLRLVAGGAVFAERRVHHRVVVCHRLTQVELVDFYRSISKVHIKEAGDLPLMMHSKARFTFEESSALVSISAICSRSA